MCSAPARLRVLARPAFSNQLENPYNALIYGELPRLGVDVFEYSPLGGLFGRYDIVHVHWPESTFNASLPEAWVTTQSLISVVDRLRRRGAKLVWTAHNLRAHEQRHPRAEAAFWREFVARVDAVFSLSESALAPLRARFPELVARPTFVTPHPHYRSRCTSVPRSEARAQLGLAQDAAIVLFFGRIFEYKNVPALIEVVQRLPQLTDGRRVELVIAGKPRSSAIAEALEAAAHGEPRIRLMLRHLSEHDTSLCFGAADLVALPYRDILNSGTALLALSFDRKVLMPRLGAAPELARLVGERWLELYDELGPATLEGSLLRARELPNVSDGRQLASLEPSRIARLTADAYRALAGSSNVPRARRSAGLEGAPPLPESSQISAP